MWVCCCRFSSCCPHCLSVSLCVCFLCLLFCYLYEAQFLCLILFFFSINVFPIILVIIIIILSTTFFSIICKWTTFVSKDECQRQSYNVSAMFDVVVAVLLKPVHALESNVFAPNWVPTATCQPHRWQLNLSCQMEPNPTATGLQVWSYQIYLLFWFCVFCFFFLLNVEVPNYIIKFTCFCCLCIVLYCFSSFLFLGGFNYIKL